MTKSPTHHRVQVIVPIAQYRRWEAESARTGVPISELVRRAMAAAITKPKS